MVTKVNGKSVNIPDEMIDHYVDTLGISMSEAIEMWLADNDYADNAEQDALDRTAKQTKINVGAAKGKSKEKTQKERVKKENPVKKEIISAIFERLSAKTDQIVVKNDEKYIDLVIDGRNFTINLVEHRKK